MMLEVPRQVTHRWLVLNPVHSHHLGGKSSTGVPVALMSPFPAPSPTRDDLPPFCSTSGTSGPMSLSGLALFWGLGDRHAPVLPPKMSVTLILSCRNPQAHIRQTGTTSAKPSPPFSWPHQGSFKQGGGEIGPQQLTLSQGPCLPQSRCVLHGPTSGFYCIGGLVTKETWC